MSATVGLWEHFRRLFQFNGREDRASFWPYAALVYGIMTIGSVLAMVPVFLPTTFTSDQVAPAMPNLLMIVDGMMLTALLCVRLYAAAVARRLHDGGLSGLWGLVPLPFLLFSMTRMRNVFHELDRMQQSMRSFESIFVSNLLYMLTIIGLIVLLCRRSDPRPNRFDPSMRSQD